MQQYLETHPWINFQIDLRSFDPELWLALGESQSKCEHIAGVPLQPATVAEFYTVYFAKGVNATTAIEGNTLSEEQVRKHMEGELELPPSQDYLKHEIQNMVIAYNAVVTDIMNQTGDHLSVCVDDILRYNYEVLEGLDLAEKVEPGKIRQHGVVIPGFRYRGAPAEDCKYLLERLCEWLRSPDSFDRIAGNRIVCGIIRAVVAHLYIAWIHPFGDGNGRTARLLEFRLMLEAGVPVPAAHLLSDHYNITRTRYYRELDLSHRVEMGATGFLKYAVEGLVDGLQKQIDLIRDKQKNVAWEKLIHDTFRALPKKTPTTTRRRDIVLDLSLLDAPLPVSKVRTGISERVSAEYEGFTSKAVTRDINTLVRMGLIKKISGRIEPNRERIEAFLPVRRTSSAPSSDIDSNE